MRRFFTLGFVVFLGFVLAQGDLGYARNLIARGEYALAVVTLQKELARRPAEAWGLLAQAYLFEGERDEAAKALEQAERFGWKGAELYWLKGWLSFYRGDLEAAGTNFLRAAALSREPRYALDWGIATLLRAGPEEAREALETARGRGREGEAAFLEGLGLFAGDPEAALTRFQTAYRTLPLQHPVALQARYWAGRALERLGRVREAREAYRALLRLVPDDALAQEALGRLGP